MQFSQRLSKVRIHVERIIELLKNKYTILQSMHPVTMLHYNKECGTSVVDEVVHVCAALINLCPSVVDNSIYSTKRIATHYMVPLCQYTLICHVACT